MIKELMNNLLQCLCPPGNGVYTVSTAKEKKDNLHQLLYGATGEEAVNHWKKSLEKINNDVILLGICSDTGGGIQRGANWGPLFIREALYESNSVNFFDLGDIRVIPQLLHDKYLNDQTISNCRAALYDDKNSDLPVSPLSIAEYVVSELLKAFPDKKILTLGGDHSISYPVIKAYLQQRSNNIGVIQFDAHTDLLHERLGIDITFGSWTSHILQYMNDPSTLIQLGIRASAHPKEHWEKTFGIKQFTMDELNALGIQKLIDQVVDHFNKKEIRDVYITFDIDALDSNYISATGTPEPGGLHPENAIKILEALAQQFNIIGADITELAPNVTHATSELLQPQTTIQTAKEITEALLQCLQANV